MAKEYASAAPARAAARDRRDRAAVRNNGGAATHGKARLARAALLLVVGALLVGAGAIGGSGVAAWADGSAGNRHAASSAAPAVDPRLILVPRTVSQTATAGGVTLDLTASPLLPGSNRFALRLAEDGRPLSGARVLLVARMEGMAMPPVTLAMSEARPGQYAATGPLTMFGQWQLTAQVIRAGMVPVAHQFALSLDLPPGLLAAPGTGRAPRQSGPPR